MLQIANITFLVADYDEAIHFFTDKLRFVCHQDLSLSDKKRWVVVGTKLTNSSNLLLAKASNSAQEALIGKQTADRVSFFLNTDDFHEQYNFMKSKDVKFLENPREEPYGTVVVFEDLYGNKWDLIQTKEK